MPRLLPAITLAGALCCAAACESSKPTEPQKSKPAKPSKSSEPSEPVEPSEPAKPSEVEGSPSASAEPPASAEPAPAPAWYDATKIQHSAVLNQIASQGAIAGGKARAMVLELEPGVSNQQCIDRAKAAIGESVAEVPEATAGDDGRLTLQGKTDDYHYTVVCGEAKGKPTMYLSYTAQ